MSEYVIGLRAFMRQEGDGSRTVVVEITGLPDVAQANRVSDWVRDCLRQGVGKLGGRLDDVIQGRMQ
jgi:hypothetical protein